MSGETARAAGVAAEMRRAFDQAFQAPARGTADKGETFIEIRVAGEEFVVKTLETMGVARAPRIVSIPSRLPEVMGLAAIRGCILPVYDLAALLGLGASGKAPFLTLVKCDVPVGLAIEGFDWVARAVLYEIESAPSRQYIRQFARIGSRTRPVIDIPGIAAAIRLRCGASAPVKE